MQFDWISRKINGFALKTHFNNPALSFLMANPLSTQEIKAEITKYKTEKSKLAKGHRNLYILAWKEFYSKCCQYWSVRNNAQKGYDEIINSLENSLRAAKAMDPKYRLKRKAAISLACVACLYVGTQISQAPEHQAIQPYAAAKNPAKVESTFWYFPGKGESLADIARKVSGNASNSKSIQQYNKLESSQVSVPIKIPERLASNKQYLHAGSLEGRLYIVAKSDTWPGVSQKVFGMYNREHELKSLNKKYNPRFSDRLSDNGYILVPK